MVYFIQDMRTRLIKIGYTSNMPARLQVLCSQFGSLRLLTTIDGMAEREREIHNLFSADRVKGEWFKISDNLCQFITQLNTRLTLNSNTNALWKAGKRLSK